MFAQLFHRILFGHKRMFYILILCIFVLGILAPIGVFVAPKVAAQPFKLTGPFHYAAIITAPFTFDGAGAFCWQSSNLGSYINSWNTTSVTINGVNATNLYVAAGSFPAKINGYRYVAYTSAVSYGHFDAN